MAELGMVGADGCAIQSARNAKYKLVRGGMITYFDHITGNPEPLGEGAERHFTLYRNTTKSGEVKENALPEVVLREFEAYVKKREDGQ